LSKANIQQLSLGTGKGGDEELALIALSLGFSAFESLEQFTVVLDLSRRCRLSMISKAVEGMKQFKNIIENTTNPSS